MLELEIQKLTAAITALTEELRLAKVSNELPTEKETPTNSDKPRQRKPKVTQEEVEALVEAATPVENTVVTDQPLKDKVEEIVSAITAEDLKTVAMEIARADSSARPLILSILSEHGAKTITQLDPKHYQEVHGRLMSIAYDIAKNGEVTL